MGGGVVIGGVLKVFNDFFLLSVLQCLGGVAGIWGRYLG